MTPEEYVILEQEQRTVIEAAAHKICKARKQANKAKHPPKNELRKLEAADVKPGLIVWHDDGDEGWFWHVIDEPQYYGDDWKAYIADDGSRYGLRGAWVRK